MTVPAGLILPRATMSSRPASAAATPRQTAPAAPFLRAAAVRRAPSEHTPRQTAPAALAAAAASALERHGAEAGDAKGQGSAAARKGLRSAGQRRHLNGQTSFARQMERAVDALAAGPETASYEEVQRILADIRRQYDEVHCEAGKREQELLAIRRNIHLAEAEKRVLPDTWDGESREEVQQRIDKVSEEIEEALETKQVYEHIVGRLRREVNIVRQKVNIMEGHLRRKTTEVERKHHSCRRMHEEKVACINMLETIEQDVEAEREACSNALEDLQATSKLKQDEVRHREEFERWRYVVAEEAAAEAFQATAGRFWKIYAVEKLTGNCLQKITFEQLETSQMTEDGFQKIREVTGLTDVMDIVHKFLNRNVEHEQLKVAVREAEERLEELRKAEAEAKGEHGALLELMLDSAPREEPGRPRRLHVDVAQHQEDLANVAQTQEELQKRLRRGGLLFEGVRCWGQRMARSLAPLEQLGRLDSPGDLPGFFAALAGTVDRLLDRARSEMPAPRLAKAAGQAGGRERAEQLRLLTDRDFLRANCRVPASLDAQGYNDEPRRARGGQGQGRGKEEEDQEEDFMAERDRVKGEPRESRERQLGKRRSNLASSGGPRAGGETSRRASQTQEVTRRASVVGTPRARQSLVMGGPAR